MHIALMSSAQWAVAKQALADAGHEVVAEIESDAAKKWAALKAEYPNLVDDINEGIAELKDETMSGGEKAVAVAGQVMKGLADAAQAIPGIKDLLVHGVTETFVDTLSELEHVTVEVFQKTIGGTPAAT